MRNGNIISIAAQLGWTASAQYKEGRFSLRYEEWKYNQYRSPTRLDCFRSVQGRQALLRLPSEDLKRCAVYLHGRNEGRQGNGNIISIAAQLGWTASAQYKEGRLFFDFHRKTLSGVPFTVTAEMKDGKVSNLVMEIESFVEAIEPETCASEWMVLSGAVAPSRFRQARNEGRQGQ